MPTDINGALRLFGLENSWNLSELERAYRKLAVKYHPDRCCEKKKARCREKFKDIAVARKILEDYYINRKHINEYEEHTARFYSDLFGSDIK